ncbi:F-box protein [Phanerochaete sordida]|uniref:F-box protein n=1 Tax=Phanerochaete sordida TaxID=48140 RepID=A0A9P3GD93_9APHY|nr:F-box protein [Phanerochaete sordida]
MFLRLLSEGSLHSWYSDYSTSVDFGYNAKSDHVAIGHFDGTGGYKICMHHGRPLIPTGEGVESRRVAGQMLPAEFTKVVEMQHGKRVLRETPSQCTKYNAYSCNIAVHRPCWEYLQTWINCTQDPRFGRDGKPLTLAGEVYEITASRHEAQKECRGSLPCINYGGTIDAYMGTPMQDFIVGPRKGTTNIVKALQKGLREVQLVPALLRDSRFWMWARPDIWPRAPVVWPRDPIPLSAVSGTALQPIVPIRALPNELFPEVLQHCHLEDIFALGSTCKELYACVLDRATLAHAVRKAIRNRASPLQWLLPVPALRKEWLAACVAMQTWLKPSSGWRQYGVAEKPMDEDHNDDAYSIATTEKLPSDFQPSPVTPRPDNNDEGGEGEGGTQGYDEDDELFDFDFSIPDGEDDDWVQRGPQGHDEGGNEPNRDDAEGDEPPLPPLPLFDPAFPIVDFLRAYRTSASMHSRRRRWTLIKQWDALFANYRRDGWERDEFTPPGTNWAICDDGRMRCQCALEEEE